MVWEKRLKKTVKMPWKSHRWDIWKQDISMMIQLQLWEDAFKELTSKFEGLCIARSGVNSFLKQEMNMSFKKVELHTEARNSPETINKRYEWGAILDDN
ncbi:hypothetical protein DFQ28_006328 [Apophysomyces sp. BC1034]|nr:hypothetical protein DFQ30_003562 [Apophysomyces sp. BC1015]KAG0187446.1 hypothetical protein DFQ28_006328 [Apophysomyces sp. BC1034]